MIFGKIPKLKIRQHDEGGFFGEIEGDRTLDFQDHNLTL